MAGLVEQHEQADVNDLEGIVGQLGANVAGVLGFHEIVSPVPLRIVARHDVELGLPVHQSVLQAMKIFGGIVDFEAGNTIEQDKTGNQE